MPCNKKFRIINEKDGTFYSLKFFESNKLPRKNMTSASAVIFHKNKILADYINNKKEKLGIFRADI
ncbi:MAG: hypothetical protein KAQ64_00525 [Candidatus Pacebacteria bacterium]|nr:hypothetical protein [Candidatus Paceibacterota bacterium]